jgi:hypothetical protein
MAKEEVSKEYREWYAEQKGHLSGFLRKMGYMPTCEYCFSFWFILLLCMCFSPRLYYEDWRGYVLAHGVSWALCVSEMTVYQMARVCIRKHQHEMDQ